MYGVIEEDKEQEDGGEGAGGITEEDEEDGAEADPGEAPSPDAIEADAACGDGAFTASKASLRNMPPR